MKRKRTFLITVVVLGMIVSASCIVSPHAEATPTSDYIFTPVTTPLQFEPDSLPNAQLGVEYEVEIKISDNVTPVSNVTLSDGTLPTGLELVFGSQNEGIKISGTPEEKGTFTFTLLVSCFGTMTSGQSGQKAYTILVE